MLLLSGFYAIGQKRINGTVVDAATNAPIPGASVFISNSSNGTVSDKNGYFELTDVPLGKQELIISSIGYETNAYTFSPEQLPLKLRVQLGIKVRELANVVVEPSVREGWDKWGQTFSENFTGSVPNATHCRIKNYKSIQFQYFRNSNRLVAWSDEPLIFENKALGYTITYQLENFEVDFKNNVTVFAGYPLFTDHAGPGKNVKNRWQRNRNKAYYGSMMHFMRGVYNNKLLEDGYEVRRMTRTPNFEKKRVQQLYRSGRVNWSTLRNTGATLVDPVNDGKPVGPDSTAVDSSGYYSRIMAQPDNIDVYGSTVLTADSLIVATDGEFKVLYFPDYLYITYKREREDRAYLDFYHLGRKPQPQGSHVWLQNSQPVTIDANGSYYPSQEVFTMSYWGWSEKIANLLPLDFQPGE